MVANVDAAKHLGAGANVDVTANGRHSRHAPTISQSNLLEDKAIRADGHMAFKNDSVGMRNEEAVPMWRLTGISFAPIVLQKRWRSIAFFRINEPTIPPRALQC